MPVSHKHQFNRYPDYVSALPADELVKVGMIKQDMYNQGVQQVQSYMDELSSYGLDLVREVDKKYFVGQMDKLTASINKSASGTDFSNINNVRSLLTIGRPLENDPNLINSLQSTQEFRRRQEELSKMKTGEGGRSAVNDWHFFKDAEQWYSSDKVGESLAYKQYTPYKDASKYVMDAAAKMQPDIEAEIIKKNGYLNQSEVKKLTESRLQEWMQNSLPPEILNQVRMDAEFDAKDLTPEQARAHVISSRDEQFKEVRANIAAYEGMSKTRALSQEEKVNLQRLKDRAQVIAQSISEVASGDDQQAFDGFIEDHYRHFITGQAKAYAYTQEKKAMTADPFALAYTHGNIALSNWKAQQEYNIEHGLDQKSLQEAKDAADLEKTKLMYGDGAAGVLAPEDKAAADDAFRGGTQIKYGEAVFDKLPQAIKDKADAIVKAKLEIEDNDPEDYYIVKDGDTYKVMERDTFSGNDEMGSFTDADLTSAAPEARQLTESFSPDRAYAPNDLLGIEPDKVEVLTKFTKKDLELIKAGTGLMDPTNITLEQLNKIYNELHPLGY